MGRVFQVLMNQARYLTRDVDVSGRPSDIIDGWSVRPVRAVDPDYPVVIWIPFEEGRIDTLVSRYYVKHARKIFTAIPDDGSQVIVIGGYN